MLETAMTPTEVRLRLPVDNRDLVPPSDLFLHASRLHGQGHVARVLVHAMRLVAATGLIEETARLWAAVYLHDIARQHDGYCTRHGADAWARLATLPHVEALLARGGVSKADYPAIETAITHHCRSEVARDHPHWELTALLKDADGLDRVRLADLDPRYLRHPEAKGMIAFAERLYAATADWPPWPDWPDRLWTGADRATDGQA
jgi:hypothetical protein